MSRTRRLIAPILVLSPLVCLQARANTYSAASCNTSDVQTAINSASTGDTVLIPPGTCTWTSAVTISSKGIDLVGAGSGRVIAMDIETSAETIGTGTKTFSFVSSARADGTIPSISAGQTLRIIEVATLQNFMQGTVTSYNGSVLTMNITSAGGTCGQPSDPNGMQSNCKRWMITSIPAAQTIICVNLSGTSSIFTVTEDTTFHTSISGFFIGQGNDSRCSGVSGNGGDFKFYYASGGQAILVHDNFVEMGNSGGEGLESNTNRGVIWNNSFMNSPFNQSNEASLHIKDDSGSSIGNSWTTAALWGSLDTTGQAALYVENNDFHASNGGTDWDSNSRAVFRYNFLDNYALATHGSDTSTWGMRTLEVYNNVGIFQGYNDGTTANLNDWIFWRGGTLVWHDNNLAAIGSTDHGSRSDIRSIVMTLRRQDAQNSCWGAGFITPGQYYPAPRQIGFGRVTGAGRANYPPDGVNNSSTDVVGYVGDSEPAYFWNNSRTVTVALNDYVGPEQCPTSPTPDSTADYFKIGRDYFEGANNIPSATGTPKPGYTPYTYPHPLRANIGSLPNPPTGLAVIVK